MAHERKTRSTQTAVASLSAPDYCRISAADQPLDDTRCGYVLPGGAASVLVEGHRLPGREIFKKLPVETRNPRRDTGAAVCRHDEFSFFFDTGKTLFIG